MGQPLSLNEPSCLTDKEDKKDDDGMIVVIKEGNNEKEKISKTFIANVSSEISWSHDFEYDPKLQRPCGNTTMDWNHAKRRYDKSIFQEMIIYRSSPRQRQRYKDFDDRDLVNQIT